MEFMEMPQEMIVKEEKPSNRIWVGEINDQTAQAFIDSVYRINEDDERKPIVVLINSDGGSVHSLLAMQSVMDSVSNPFITVALGRAFSAGADLLAHGDMRFVSPYCRVMIHETSGVVGGHVDDVKGAMEEFHALNILSMELLAKNMKKTTAELKALFLAKGRDMHLSSQEAVALGLADHVGVPQVREVPPTLQPATYEIGLPVLTKPSTLRRNVSVFKNRRKKK